MYINTPDKHAKSKGYKTLGLLVDCQAQKINLWDKH